MAGATGSHASRNHASPQNPRNSRDVYIEVMSRVACMLFDDRAGVPVLANPCKFGVPKMVGLGPVQSANTEVLVGAVGIEPNTSNPQVFEITHSASSIWAQLGA